MTQSILTLSTAMLLFAPAVFAAEFAKNNDRQLQEVVIEASRIPQTLGRLPFSAQTVSGRDVQLAQPQLGLDESLVAVPGLFLQNRTNFAQDLRISIRGFGARASFGIRGVKILVDGIPETLPDGQGGIDGIDLASVGSIEVLRGPASSLYGNASGGVINISTEFDPQTFIEARTAHGGDGYSKQQLKSGGSIGSFDYLSSLSHLEIDGFREHSEHRNTSFNSRFRYRFENNATLNFSASETDQPIANDPGGINLADFEADGRQARSNNVDLNAGESVEQSRVGLRLVMPVAEHSQITARSYLIKRDFLGRIPLSGNGTIAFDRTFFGGGVTYQLQLGKLNSGAGQQSNGKQGAISNARNVFLIGIDYDLQDDDRQRFQNNNGIAGTKVLDQREKVTSVGTFVQNRFSINEHWDITTGARYDEVKFDVTDNFGDNSGARTLTQFSPSIGSLYHVIRAINLFANFSTSFETPTTTELAVPATTGINTELDPQRSKSFEVGIKGAVAQRLSYSAAVFDIEVKDEIVGFETPAGDDVFVNAAESTRRGFELQTTVNIIDQLSIAFAYTYSDFSFDDFIDDDGNDFSNNEIPGLPENTLHWQLDYHQQVSQNTAIAFIFDTLYVDSFALNNANSAQTDSYTVSNLRGAVTISVADVAIEPFLGISNVFNEKYIANGRINAFGGRFFEAAPDRNVYGGIAVKWQP